MPKECRSESSRQSARTGHPAQIAMARAACSRARPTSAVSGNHSSGSRHEVAHRACRYTRPNSSRSFGSPDRHCTGRGETVVTTGCTSSRSSPLQPLGQLPGIAVIADAADAAGRRGPAFLLADQPGGNQLLSVSTADCRFAGYQFLGRGLDLADETAWGVAILEIATVTGPERYP